MQDTIYIIKHYFFGRYKSTTINCEVNDLEADRNRQKINDKNS